MTPSASPRLLKAALVTIDLPNPLPTVIAFQYNPGTLTRTLQPKTTAENTGRNDVLRFRGAPVETITLEIELDALDLDPTATAGSQLGLHPQLAALERLLYPPSSDVIANQVQLALGVIEVIPPPAPLTLFVFGRLRVLPVRLTEFRVTEEVHDADLNPLQARINLGMQVVSYDDLPPYHPGSAIFLAHQVAKEVMAGQASTHTLNAVAGGNIRIL